MEVLMDHILPRESEYVGDGESGRISDEVGNHDPGFTDKLANKIFTKFCRGFTSVHVLVKGGNFVKVCVNSSNCDEVSPGGVKLLVDESFEGEKSGDITEKNTRKDKRKSTSAKKPPKPPRPSGLSLDAADQKLIKEIAELAMLKRARIERMKALKKMRAEKSSSSNGSLFAMIVTILFCLVMLFQGMSWGSSPLRFQGSPETARATESGFILVQDHLNPSSTFSNLPDSKSPNLVEQISGSDHADKASGAMG